MLLDLLYLAVEPKGQAEAAARRALRVERSGLGDVTMCPRGQRAIALGGDGEASLNPFGLRKEPMPCAKSPLISPGSLSKCVKAGQPASGRVSVERLSTTATTRYGD